MCVVDLDRLWLILYSYEIMSMMFLERLHERALTWAGPRPVRSRSPRTSPPRLPSSTSSEPYAPYSRSLEPAKIAVAHRASNVNLTLRALRLASLSFARPARRCLRASAACYAPRFAPFRRLRPAAFLMTATHRLRVEHEDIVELTPDAIDVAALLERVKDASAGAVCSFLGTTRDSFGASRP